MCVYIYIYTHRIGPGTPVGSSESKLRARRSRTGARTKLASF